MIKLARKRQALKDLVAIGAMPRQNADRIMEAERDTTGVRLEARRSEDGTSGEILLYDVVDSWGGFWGVSAVEFREALDSLGDVEELVVRINSPGGEVSEGNAMHNALVDHPARVRVVVDGMAASIASIVAMAGDHIEMNRGAEMMIHNSWMVTVGDTAVLAKDSNLLGRLDRVAADIYAARAGGTREEWLAAMAEETWYLGQEAVDAGLADSAAPLKTKNDDGGPSSLWDRSLFNKIDTGADAGGEDPTDDAPEDPGDAAATAAATGERQRALQVVTRARLAAAGVPIGQT